MKPQNRTSIDKATAHWGEERETKREGAGWGRKRGKGVGQAEEASRQPAYLLPGFVQVHTPVDDRRLPRCRERTTTQTKPKRKVRATILTITARHVNGKRDAKAVGTHTHTSARTLSVGVFQADRVHLDVRALCHHKLLVDV